MYSYSRHVNLRNYEIEGSSDESLKKVWGFAEASEDPARIANASCQGLHKRIRILAQCFNRRSEKSLEYGIISGIRSKNTEVEREYSSAGRKCKGTNSGKSNKRKILPETFNTQGREDALAISSH